MENQGMPLRSGTVVPQSAELIARQQDAQQIQNEKARQAARKRVAATKNEYEEKYGNLEEYDRLSGNYGGFKRKTKRRTLKTRNRRRLSRRRKLSRRKR